LPNRRNIFAAGVRPENHTLQWRLCLNVILRDLVFLRDRKCEIRRWRSE
jgi:hypothetical protein